jgi:urease accessory protein
VQPFKGGPGITKSALLVINKTDLAPDVDASLEVMDRDAKKMRDERPFVFTSVRQNEGLQAVVDFVIREGMLSSGVLFGLAAHLGRRAASRVPT